MTQGALAVGLAQLLQGAGVAVWDPTGVYADPTVGITIQSVPETPSQLVAITTYPVSDDPNLNDSVVGVQIRTRGDQNPQTVLDRDDAVFAALQGHRGTVNGVPVVQIYRQSSLPLGQDQNQRWERSSNYYAHVAWPTANRTD